MERVNDDLMLVPQPRVLERIGVGPPPGWTNVRIEVVPELGPESYELVVDRDGAHIRHGDDHARRYAEDTLDRLRHQTDRLPGLRIADRPDFAVRGYMLDISRDRVPTRATLERIVDVMTLVRLNHLQLYTEHTFAYADHEVVWRDASPMTAEDVRWLDALCAERGIELVANQNSFGHMERWLRHEAYRERAECPDGFEQWGRTRPPTTLAPTPDNAEFSLSLLRELLAHHPSRRVNIGCDETWELGRCRSAEDAERRGKPALFAEHLSRLAEPLAADGYEVLFWADMIRTHPELIGELPEAVQPIAWTYEQPRTEAEMPELPEPIRRIVEQVGIELAAHMGFTGNVAPLAEADIGFWVAPGTSTWNSLVGRIDNAFANIADACAVGTANASEGLLLTDWGDNGHLQPPSVSFPPIVYAGVMSWCAEANRDLDVADVLDADVFGDHTRTLGRLLDRVGRLWGRTGQRAFNASPLQASLCPHQMHMITGAPDADALGSIADTLSEALADLEEARPSCVDADTVVTELEVAVRLARQGAWRLAGRDPDDLAPELAELIDSHRHAWSQRSRTGGLDDSAAQLSRTLGV